MTRKKGPPPVCAGRPAMLRVVAAAAARAARTIASSARHDPAQPGLAHPCPAPPGGPWSARWRRTKARRARSSGSSAGTALFHFSKGNNQCKALQAQKKNHK